MKTHRNGNLVDFGSFWIGKKNAKIPRCVSEVHFGHFLTMFYHFFAACQARKYCNLQCFSALGMKKIFLQHAENYVNTGVFARSGPKKIANTVIFATRGKKRCKYRRFGFPRCLKHWYLQCFLLRECQKNAKTTPI